MSPWNGRRSPPRRQQQPHDIQRAGQFRRQRHQPHAVFRRPVLQTPHRAGAGAPGLCAALAAGLRNGLRSADPAVGRAPTGRGAARQRRLAAAHLRQRCGDDGGQKGGDARSGQPLGHGQMLSGAAVKSWPKPPLSCMSMKPGATANPVPSMRSPPAAVKCRAAACGGHDPVTYHQQRFVRQRRLAADKDRRVQSIMSSSLWSSSLTLVQPPGRQRRRTHAPMLRVGSAMRTSSGVSRKRAKAASSRWRAHSARSGAKRSPGNAAAQHDFIDIVSQGHVAQGAPVRSRPARSLGAPIGRRRRRALRIDAARHKWRIGAQCAGAAGRQRASAPAGSRRWQETIVSRQPRLPQPQSTPLGSTVKWPNSPASPWRGQQICPSRMTPAAIPVPSAT